MHDPFGNRIGNERISQMGRHMSQRCPIHSAKAPQSGLLVAHDEKEVVTLV